MFKKFFANNLSPKKYFENTNWQPPLKNKMAAQGDVIDDNAEELHLIVARPRRSYPGFADVVVGGRKLRALPNLIP